MNVCILRAAVGPGNRGSHRGLFPTAGALAIPHGEAKGHWCRQCPLCRPHVAWRTHAAAAAAYAAYDQQTARSQPQISGASRLGAPWRGGVAALLALPQVRAALRGPGPPLVSTTLQGGKSRPAAARPPAQSPSALLRPINLSMPGMHDAARVLARSGAIHLRNCRFLTGMAYHCTRTRAPRSRASQLWRPKRRPRL